MKRLALESLAATRALGARLGAALQPGDTVGLVGGLGAGKTALAQAIAGGAGVDESEVSSPTFTLIHSYRAHRLTVHHADLYRLEAATELEAIGYFELLGGEGALLVEWIDRLPSAAPTDWLRLELTPAERPEARWLEARASGPRSQALLAVL